jgi:uncharacterized RDD family membrane protein YckC
MNDHDPLKPPSPEFAEIAGSSDAEFEVTDDAPAISTANTIVPRYVAAFLDNIIAAVLGVVAAKAVSGDLPFVQFGLLVGVYFGYYFLFEGMISRTPGKLVTGLVVTRYDGRRCGWGQAAIRTGFRLLEVNPILVGALPAALSIICTRHRQRFGDKAARTIVVPSRRLPRTRVSKEEVG